MCTLPGTQRAVAKAAWEAFASVRPLTKESVSPLAGPTTHPDRGSPLVAVPFVGPDGTLYVSWNAFHNTIIAFNRSFDGGMPWDTQRTIAAKTLAFDIGIPAESFRGALVYPACDADRSDSSHRGRLYCSWMDLTQAGTTDIFVSFSHDRGSSWSTPARVADQLPLLVDRFNQWLSVDPVTGNVNLSFYDTRNDTTGQRFMP